MKFFTSRYTAALEEQVIELKAQVVSRDHQIERLTEELFARMKPGDIAGPIAIRADKDKPEPPRSVNWLRAVRALETPDQIVREAPEKEKPANGTR